MTERAERSDTSCSPERPPNTTPTRIRRPVRSPVANALHLRFELDAELLRHGRAGALDQRRHVGGRGAAEVDDEVRVPGRYLRPADLQPFQPGRLDQAPGVVAGRVR